MVYKESAHNQQETIKLLFQQRQLHWHRQHNLDTETDHSSNNKDQFSSSNLTVTTIQTISILNPNSNRSTSPIVTAQQRDQAMRRQQYQSDHKRQLGTRTVMGQSHSRHNEAHLSATMTTSSSNNNV